MKKLDKLNWRKFATTKFNNANVSNLNADNPHDYPFFINGRDDVVFVHIPKTAGTSIRKTFNFNTVNKDAGIKKHNNVVKIISLIGNEKWNHSFKFTFVRNPWDRMLSHYYFALRKGIVPNLDEQSSFKLWALNKIYKKQKNKKLTFNLQPQVRWLKNQDGIIDINFIGRFERLNEDFSILKNRISNESASLIHSNKNPLRLNYRDHYDTELKEKVTQFYQEDLDYFKYTF